MESIEMRYTFKDGDNTAKEIRLCAKDRNDEGLQDYDVCALFIDLMESAGYSMENILKYFKLYV